MDKPPFEITATEPRSHREGHRMPFFWLALWLCGSVANPLHSSEEPEEPRREAVEIDKDVVRVGVGQTEPAGQRVAVLVHRDRGHEGAAEVARDAEEREVEIGQADLHRRVRAEEPAALHRAAHD